MVKIPNFLSVASNHDKYLSKAFESKFNISWVKYGH
jgi:hypothetical protein